MLEFDSHVANFNELKMHHKHELEIVGWQKLKRGYRRTKDLRKVDMITIDCVTCDVVIVEVKVKQRLSKGPKNIEV